MDFLRPTWRQFRKRKRSEDPIEIEEDDLPSKKPRNQVPSPGRDPGREIILLDSDDKGPVARKGAGTQSDPIVFREWTSRNVIQDGDGGSLWVISDEEDEDDFEEVKCRSRARSRTRSLSVDSWDDIEKSPVPTSRSPSNRPESIASNNDDHDETLGTVRLSKKHLRPNALSNATLEEYRKIYLGSPETGFLDDSDGTDSEEEQDYEDLGRAASRSNRDASEFSPNQLLLDLATKQRKKGSSKDATPELTSSQDTVATEDSDEYAATQPVAKYALPHLFEPSEEFKETSALEESFSTSAIAIDRATDKVGAIWETEPDGDKKLPRKTRKYLFYHTYWVKKRSYLEGVVRNYRVHVQGEKKPDGCWLYTGPKLPKLNGAISHVMRFKHNGQNQLYSPNIMFIALLLQGLLTEEQKQGIIEEAWEASHLCGNWTCLNHAHIVVEPHLVNINRNRCFNRRDEPCQHSPECLKSLKLDGEVLQPIKSYSQSQLSQLEDTQLIEGQTVADDFDW